MTPTLAFVGFMLMADFEKIFFFTPIEIVTILVSADFQSEAYWDIIMMLEVIGVTHLRT
jgi:hypothetical protein